jgi:hypothetical protein
MKQPRSAHLDMALYTWFTEPFSKSKHVPGSMTKKGGGGVFFLHSPSIGAQQKITCKHLGKYPYCSVIRHLSGPLDARLRGFLL